VSSHTIPIVPKGEIVDIVEPGLLVHLSELDSDYMLAAPYVDFRGWDVMLPDSTHVGKVDDLIADTSDMQVRYVEVKLDRDLKLSEEHRRVLLPLEAVRLLDDDDRIVIDRLPVGGLAGAPRWAGRLPSDAEQQTIRAYFQAG
jgi:sporulation protein YlmC with PRC-barrel domain